MNVKVEAYLADQERQAQAEKQAYREKILLAAGLAEKVYSPHEQSSQEYPHYDPDEMRSYKLVYEEVTEEEFAKIEVYAKKNLNAVTEEKTMFSNIGEKIRSVAMMFCWIGIGLSIVLGLVTMAQDSDLALVGIVIAAAGSLGSWITSLFLYGFGELIVKVNEIAEHTKK